MVRSGGDFRGAVGAGDMEHATCPLKTTYGESTFHCFSFGPHEEDNILCIAAGAFRESRLLRVQSACYTAEIFRSTDCDCHAQLDESLQRIHDIGGLLLYMLCDGRGAGLLTKVRGLALGASDALDTHEAYVRLGVAPDPRVYSRVCTVLDKLGLDDVRLLTNNPRKLDGLRSHGIAAERIPLEIRATPDSRGYLETKRDKFGHMLSRLKLDGQDEGADGER